MIKATEEHEALCLKVTPFREADVIAAFYTPEVGLIRAVCKGVKKSTSKLAGACQPLTLNRLQLTRGKSQAKNNHDALFTLTGYQRLNEFERTRSQLLPSVLASTLAEIVYGLSHDGDTHLIFNHLCQVLGKLESICFENPSAQLEKLLPAILQFNLDLLQDLGYALLPENCVVCHDCLNPHNPFQAFTAQLGGFVCQNCYKALPYLTQQTVVKVSQKSYFGLCNPQERIETETAEALMRFLTYLWEFRLEKKLNSPAVMQQLLTVV